ncbi:hypothetical protein [Marinisporobacter balticus]|uniref:Uncharacterized protein n=1 Tax=Marinisporobacter balticus TaxID=2018667 RepID=A0A4R2KYD4_9FIRM|nr:hypothetical protein [Marinisporobacter balticus]TCO77907.1 hypothetical protein EV214_1053 [Marinisporobacter balticus]
MRNDNDLTPIDKDDKKVQKNKINTPLGSLIKGISGIVNICSDMMENEEDFRQYEGAINKTSNTGENIKGLYKFGIQVGDLDLKEQNQSKNKSIASEKEPIPKIEIIEHDGKTIIKFKFKNILKEKVKFSQIEAVCIQINEEKEYSKKLGFNKENYRIEGIEYNFPYLFVTLVPNSNSRGDKKNE